MITEIYNKGEVIANEGEAANSFFIIKKVNSYLRTIIYKGKNFFMTKIIETTTKFKGRRFVW